MTDGPTSEPTDEPTDETASGPTDESATGAPIGGAALVRSRRQLENYVIYSLDGIYVVLLAMFARAVADQRQWSWLTVIFSLSGVLAICWGAYLTHRRGRGHRATARTSAGFAAAAALVSPLGIVASDAVALGLMPEPLTGSMMLWGVFTGVLVPMILAGTTLSALLPWRRAGLVAVPTVLVIAAIAALAGLPAEATWRLVVASLSCYLAGMLTGSFSVWMVDVIAALDTARITESRLAVAQERLRFARDMHDVYGRALASIAMKSELAAELATRGDPRAVEQMRGTHQLARAAMTQARGVISGYRHIDLAVELHGAAAILQAAGAQMRVQGVDELSARCSPPQRTVLAWAVREGATNIIRHSRARSVHVDGHLVSATELDPAGTDGQALAGPSDTARAILTISNDGVLAMVGADPDGGADGDVAPTAGHGLTGLAERVAQVSGTMSTSVHDTTFTLRIELPLDS